jgi:hypothetical protein
MAIVPVTAMPYAAARRDELPANSTTAIQAHMRRKFTTGTKICPSVAAEVCTMVTRGTNPSCTACCVSENAPEIRAWDATTVARVAISTIG